MSLDRNLFTLLLTPNSAASRPDQGVTVVDLVDPNGVVHYRKRRFAGGLYKAELYGESYVDVTAHRRSSEDDAALCTV